MNQPGELLAPNSYAIICRAAEGVLYGATDSTTPSGHWICATMMAGQRCTYLLRGRMFRMESVIIGRIQQVPGGYLSYRGDRVLGGVLVGESVTERAALDLLTS